VLNWAAARGFRTGENPARWRGHLDKLLPARSKIAPVKHHAAMPYPDMPAFMAELRQQPDISARALEFTILTAARTGEALNASWQEIDLGTKLWVVPAERMKSGRAHRVPLSDDAVRALEQLPRLNDSDYVFPSGRIGKPLSDKAMPKIMRRLRHGYVPHGFRSTFRDWAAEQTNYPREIAEAALAHVIENRVEAAYRRGDALEKRAALMADWAAFCDAKTALVTHPVGSSAYLRALATSREAPNRAATN
jgi:integrase